MNAEKSDATVGQLISALASDTGELVRQEVRLAATEITETAQAAAYDTGMIAAGGALLHLGCLALLTASIAGLAPFVPVWASAGVVGVVFVGAGAMLLQTGLAAFRALDPLPKSTLRRLEPASAEQRDLR